MSDTTETAAIDAWVESEAAAAKWRDDGHTARLRIQDRTLVADLLCPHDGRDLAALPIEQAPKCRRGADEYGDDGQRVGPGPLLEQCVLTAIGKSWQNDELWAEGIPDQEVPRSPFPVLWRGRDQDDIEIKPKPAADQPADDEPREWGHRFVDGTGGPDESREAALELAAKFVPGFVEVVHRAGPDQPWVRAGNQPHVPSERLDQMAAHLERTRRSNDWRGHRLAELGEHPNPPKDWHPIAAPEPLLETARRWRTLGPHPAPGQDTPTHPGPGETCTEAVCVKSRAQHEAAGRIQDLTAELFPDDARGGAR